MSPPRTGRGVEDDEDRPTGEGGQIADQLLDLRAWRAAGGLGRRLLAEPGRLGGVERDLGEPVQARPVWSAGLAADQVDDAVDDVQRISRV
jgi:hypothetical protein